MTDENSLEAEISSSQSMDIYLFSNGQDSCPPRKHHISSEELTWWEATLMQLARSQYGSLHSNIELYSLEGFKIDYPQQLTSGKAYVAVVPPDGFIESGYSEYIMKASRSWEKRQARKINYKETNKSGEVIETTPSTSNVNKDDVPENIENEKNNPETLSAIKAPKLVDGSVNTTLKPCACLDNNKSKHTPLSKVTEKKKQSFNQQSPTVRKISETNSLSSKRRSSIDSKKDINQKDEPKIQNVQISDKYSSLKKTVGKKIVSSPCNNKTSLSMASKTKGQLVDSKLVSISKPTKPLNSSSEINDVPTEASIFRNTESAMQSVAVILENNKSLNAECNEKLAFCDVNKNNKTESILERTLDKTPENITLRDSVATHTKEIMSNHQTIIDTTQHSPNVAFSNKHNEDNYIVINKGDVINLKLHIEIQKEDANTASYNSKEPRSLMKVLKTEKESQVHLDNEIVVESKSFHSLLVNKVNQNVDEVGNSDFLIVNPDCNACCDYDASKINAFLTPKKYIVLLPTTKYCKQKVQSREDSEKIVAVENDKDSKELSVHNPLNRTSSNLSLGTVRGLERSHIIISVANQENLATKNKLILLRKKKSAPNRDVISNSNENKTGDVNPLSKCNVGRCDLPRIENTQENTLACPCPKICTEVSRTTAVLDKAVQTEWSNVLLQAKVQDDGHYTFHLPPLSLLKYYDA